MDWKVVGIIGTVASAVIAGVVGWYSARMKYRQLEFEYEVKLKEQYLGNAREYLGSVYIPLSISLASLNAAYKNYRARQDVASREAAFSQEIRQFLRNYRELEQNGGGAFLTSELEEIVSSFNSFLDDSLYAVEPLIKGVIEVKLPRIIPFTLDGAIKREFSSKKLSRVGRVELSVLGGNILVGNEEVVGAPISSKEFEQRFVRDMYRINRLVKDVTLGNNVGNS
jgi:hypothetical protein